jgi:hypothetical protein
MELEIKKKSDQQAKTAVDASAILTSNVTVDSDLSKMIKLARDISKDVYAVIKFKAFSGLAYRKYIMTVCNEGEIPLLVNAGLKLASKWKVLLKKRGGEGSALWTFLSNKGVIEGKATSPKDIALPRVVVAFCDVAVQIRSSLIAEVSDFEDILPLSRSNFYVSQGLPRPMQQLGFSDIVPTSLEEVYINFSLEVGKILNKGSELSEDNKTLTRKIITGNVGKFTCISASSIPYFITLWGIKTNPTSLADLARVMNDTDWRVKTA